MKIQERRIYWSMVSAHGWGKTEWFRIHSHRVPTVQETSYSCDPVRKLFTKMNANSVKINVRNSTNVTKLGLKEYTVGIKYLVKAFNKAHIFGKREKRQAVLVCPFSIFTKATLKMEAHSS